MNRSQRALALASASALALVTPWLASPAWASCAPPPTGNITTTCTGNTSGVPFGLQPTGDHNVIINLGTVTGTLEGIDIDSDFNTVNNFGTVTGTNAAIGIFGNSTTVNNNGALVGTTAGITIVTLNNTVTNNASITATTEGILIFGVSGGGNSVINNGTITADQPIVITNGGNAVTNNGTLTGTSQGINITGANNTVVNSGLITGAQAIVITSNGNAVTNNGTITATSQGINATGVNNTVVNNATITVPGGIGINLQSLGGGSIVNNGTITSVDATRGLIGLSISTTGTAPVTNNGTLNGQVSIFGSLTNTGLITISVPGTGTTHTAGTFQQTSTGVLQLRADISGSHDSLVVDGAATLGGTLQLNLTPRFFNSQLVFANVVTASTFGGTQFATVSLTLPPSPFIRVTTAYASPTGVVTTGAVLSGGATLAAVDDAVSVILSPIPFGVPGLTINQREVGSGLDRGCAGPLSGAGNALCTNVLFAPSVNVLDSLSGEVFTGVQNPTFTIGEQFLDAMLAQVQRRRGLPCGGGQSAGGGSSGRSGRFAAWASGFGTLSGHRDGDTTLGSARLNASDGGAAAGGDMCLGPNLRVGFAFGGASSEFTLDGRTASGNTRAGLAGTYGSWASGPFYVDLALGYGHSDFSTTRNIALNAITERATADFTGNQFASRIEAGFHFGFRGYSFIPFIGATAQVLRQNGASESSVNTATGQPGIFGLNTQAHTSYAPLPTLGASASKTFEIGETTTITPRLRVSWGYETSADRQSSSSFQALSGASFTVNGARPARSGLNLRAGVDGDLFGLVEFYAQVDSAIAAGGNGFSAAAGVRMAW